MPIRFANSIFVSPLRLRATVNLDGLNILPGLGTSALDLNVDLGSLGDIAWDLNVLAAKRNRRQNDPFSPRINLTVFVHVDRARQFTANFIRGFVTMKKENPG
jgi:hypothetical protein